MSGPRKLPTITRSSKRTLARYAQLGQAIQWRPADTDRQQNTVYKTGVFASLPRVMSDRPLRSTSNIVQEQ